MKLSALNTAIRNHEGSVKMKLFPDWTSEGGFMVVGLVKSELLAALRERYGTDRNTETNLTFRDGFLVRENPPEGVTQ